MLEDHFAGEVAARYDETLGAMSSSEVLGPTVELLADLAGSGAALEMAIGTGRVALPLVAAGVPVMGIDLSPDMVAKPGGDDIPVVIGDMTTAQVEGEFRVVYLLYNTIGNVETQERQIACFANAAAHLEPGGCFVIEMVVPDLRRLVPGHDAIVFSHAPGYVGYDRYDDLVAQHAVSHHFVADGLGGREVRTRGGSSGPQSSTSWRSWRGWNSPTGGPAGTDRHSPETASRTSRSGASCRRCGRRWRRMAPPPQDQMFVELLVQ